MSGPGDFESELERELHRILDPIAAAPIPVRRAPSSGGIMKKRLLGGVGAALSLKLLTGVAAAAAAVVVAGAATEIAVTGSLNPVNWGQSVQQQVTDCKAAALAAGQHGIGECVSDFASSKARQNQVKDNGKANAKANGKGNSNGNSNGNGNGNGKDKTKSTGNGNSNGNGNGNGNKPSGPGIKPGPGPESSMLLVM
jgi:hypothetical protein